MITLTKDQIEAAAKAAFERLNRVRHGDGEWTPCSFDTSNAKENYREMVTLIAPLLQSPWEMPTDKEAEQIQNDWDRCRGNGLESSMYALRNWVGRRNAAIFFGLPVDPLREKIKLALSQSIGDLASKEHRTIGYCPDNVVDAVLAVLDKDSR